jgi:hypothetical protein
MYLLKLSKQITEKVVKRIRTSFCRVRGFRKAGVFKYPEANVLILAYIYVHSFLRKSEGCSNIYIPSGTFDTEKAGEIFEGSWIKAAKS